MQVDPLAATSFSVTTIDDSQTGQASKASKVAIASPRKKKQKPSNFVEEEIVSVLQELGSAVKLHKQPVTAADNEPQKIVWAGQIESKGRRMANPMLQEDLTDHLSYIVKQASRVQWSVNTIRSPTFTIAKPTKSAVTSSLASPCSHLPLDLQVDNSS